GRRRDIRRGGADRRCGIISRVRRTNGTSGTSRRHLSARGVNRAQPRVPRGNEPAQLVEPVEGEPDRRRLLRGERTNQQETSAYRSADEPDLAIRRDIADTQQETAVFLPFDVDSLWSSHADIAGASRAGRRDGLARGPDSVGTRQPIVAALPSLHSGVPGAF